MTRTTQSNIRNARKSAVVTETLEGRMMMSAAPLAIATAVVPGGLAISINGSAGDDVIRVSKSASGLKVTDGAYSTIVAGKVQSLTIHGNGGNDTIIVSQDLAIRSAIFGDAGNDTLIAGGGSEQLAGGQGDDTLVSIGGTCDSLTGGAGHDSFWADNTSVQTITDADTAEKAAGCVHRVGQFMSEIAAGLFPASISNHLGGESLPEPMTDTGLEYEDFSSQPLFSAAGPAEDDIRQGEIGDCYLLSALSATAKTNPDRIRQTVVSLGDGTFAVDFKQNGKDVFVRVDGQLAVTPAGKLAYAGNGSQGSIWAAIIEKAYTFARPSDGSAPAGSYENIDRGYVNEGLLALGGTACQTKLPGNFSTSTQLIGWVKQELAAGDEIVFGTKMNTNSKTLVGSHAYTVDSVETVNGQTMLVLRNPWGVDGPVTVGANDGYITVTANEALTGMVSVAAAKM